jgi:2-iminobutanoate/2-iminopropanoate deaminase
MKKAITTSQAPAAIGPYSQAIAIDGLVFISGQLPIDPATGRLIDAPIAARTSQIMRNIEAIAREAGGNLAGIVKTTIFLTDLADFQAVNSAYGEHFPGNPPARSTVQVAALPLGSNIEIEAILHLPANTSTGNR